VYQQTAGGSSVGKPNYKIAAAQMLKAIKSIIFVGPRSIGAIGGGLA